MPEVHPTPIEQDEARRQRLVRSAVRWRVIFLLLSVLLPLALYAVFERQARRLDALADHGQVTTATVTAVKRRGSATYVSYGYTAGGASYTWSVSQSDAPHRPGERFAVTYLPEDPSLSRPGADRSRASVEAASNRSFMRKAMAGAVVFVAINAALLELKLRRLRKRGPAEASGFVISPQWAGRLMALLMLAIVLGVNLADDVARVQRKAFGETPLGVPVLGLVTAVELLLFIPYFWVFDHLMRIVFQAVRDRASLSSAGLMGYILRAPKAHPELGRSRTIVIAGFAYFVLLAGSWIAYAASRGL